MHYLGKAGLATLGVGGVAGGLVAGYLNFNKQTFSTELGISVLELTGSKDKSAWEKRKNELASASDIDLDSSLSSKKQKTWADLQKWCLDNSTNSYSEKEDKKFKNFETFCTWKIGDKTWTNKIEDSIKEDDEKWDQAHKALAKVDDLPEDLETVKKKQAGSDQADRKAMHGWCTKEYKKTWKGNEDSSFTKASKYCKSTS